MWDIINELKALLHRYFPTVFVVAFLFSCLLGVFFYHFLQTIPELPLRSVLVSREFLLYYSVSLWIIWVAAGSLYIYWQSRRPPADKLHIAIATLAANSDAAASEARGFCALTRQELSRRIRGGELIHLVGPPVAPVAADCTAAKQFGRSIPAHLVLAGEVTLLGGEIQIYPLLCVAFPFGQGDDFVAAPTLTVGIETPGRIRLAETHARGIADVISAISGVASFQRADFVQAVQSLRPIAHKTVDVLVYLGAAYAFLQQFDEAASSAREAVAIDANSPDALNLLGASLLHKGHIDEAEPVLLRAFQLSPNSSEIACNLAVAAQFRHRNGRWSCTRRR